MIDILSSVPESITWELRKHRRDRQAQAEEPYWAWVEAANKQKRETQKRLDSFVELLDNPLREIFFLHYPFDRIPLDIEDVLCYYDEDEEGFIS